METIRYKSGYQPLSGDLAVKTQFDAGVWAAHVDEGEFEIALSNLFVNARDAMPNGGVFTIEARNRPDFSELQLDGDFVEVSVTDSGVGMEATTVSRCLEPFYTTKGVGNRCGLGLAQVYGFVKGSLGAVQIDSRLGIGTKVPMFPAIDRRSGHGGSRTIEFSGGNRTLHGAARRG